MAVGGFGAVDASANDFNGKITLSIVITCIVAASSGLIFGYDIGISGGVTTMKPFLEKFFPGILRKAARAETNMYCVYDSEVLTLFTSSLYLAGLVSSLLASRVTTALGRRNTMILGGCFFFAGGAMNGAAENIAMLILGRILLGLGVGFTNQAAPVYLSEIAPPKWRGAFNTGFQFFIGIGVVAANCINYVTASHKWGWRLSLGLAIVPATIMTIGAFLISDTPSSLVERGKIEQARQALRKARGPMIDVEPELEQVIRWSQVSKVVEQESFFTIFEKQYRPQLVMAFAIPFSQQLTGINIVAFYAPNIFQSVGFGNNSALLSAIILGLVNLASIMVSAAVVDRFGRRFLFIVGGIQML
ncbi:Sugar/inositol transporter, partial [Sesbania bispinosa]